MQQNALKVRAYIISTTKQETPCRAVGLHTSA
jgi:hypothetical protein